MIFLHQKRKSEGVSQLLTTQGTCDTPLANNRSSVGRNQSLPKG
jgi:hypothetical protein